MSLKIEGIVLAKTPFEDRHLVTSILLRNGKKVSVLFYGGRGGGSKQKSSIVEIGFMLSIVLRPSKKNAELYQASEWAILWNHQQIRLNHHAFYLTCFYLEVMQKISLPENLNNFHSENAEMVGLFATLSNALVLMEKSLELKQFSLHAHSVIFFTKLFLHIGVYPEREVCTFCTADLHQFSDMFLLAVEGGFACPPCMNQRKNYGVTSGRELWELMGHISHQKYHELSALKVEFKSLPKMLFHYFCYQNNFEEKDFRSEAMVF